MVATIMMIMNSRDRRNREKLRNAVLRRLNTGCHGGRWRFEQMGYHGRQVGEDLGTGRQAACRVGFFALAGQDQVGHAAADEASLQVAQRVADRGHAFQAGVIALRDFMEHARFRFAAIAIVGAGVRAKEDGVDIGAHLLRQGMHLLVDRVEHRHVEIFARDTRLVRGDHHAIASLVQAGDRFERAGNRQPFGGRFDEVRRVMVDDAVAVENNQFHRRSSHYAASLEMSATRFIMPCSDDSRARRLLRRATSSAITITSLKKPSTSSRSWARVCRVPAKSPLANAASTSGCTRETAAASFFSASSCSSATFTPPAATWLTASSFFFRIFVMRLLAAASEALSGKAANAWTASRRCTISSRRSGFCATTASISFGEKPRSRRMPRKRSSIKAVTSATGSLKPATVANCAAASASKPLIDKGRRFSSSIRSTPSAWRRSANGSLSPVGARPIAQMPTRVSSLSASATAVPVAVVGRLSPAKRGW